MRGAPTLDHDLVAVLSIVNVSRLVFISIISNRYEILIITVELLLRCYNNVSYKILERSYDYLYKGKGLYFRTINQYRRMADPI